MGYLLYGSTCLDCAVEILVFQLLRPAYVIQVPQLLYSFEEIWDEVGFHLFLSSNSFLLTFHLSFFFLNSLLLILNLLFLFLDLLPLRNLNDFLLNNLLKLFPPLVLILVINANMLSKVRENSFELLLSEN